jgi:hypothetical protein
MTREQPLPARRELLLAHLVFGPGSLTACDLLGLLVRDLEIRHLLGLALLLVLTLFFHVGSFRC